MGYASLPVIRVDRKTIDEKIGSLLIEGSAILIKIVCDITSGRRTAVDKSYDPAVRYGLEEPLRVILKAVTESIFARSHAGSER